MRNILALIGLFVVGFAAIGWYCGWYTLTIAKDPDGTLQIKTQVDTDKVIEDSSAFFHKVGAVIGQKAEKNSQPATTPGNTPGPIAPAKDTPPKDTSKSNTGFDGGWLLSPSKPVSTGKQ